MPKIIEAKANELGCSCASSILIAALAVVALILVILL